MEISEEEYRELLLYKKIVEDAMMSHLLAFDMANKLEKRLEKIKP